MKQKDVAIGGICVARVSGALVKVRVLGVCERAFSRGSRNGTRTKFRIARADNGKPLTARAAAALRPCPPETRREAPPPDPRDREAPYSEEPNGPQHALDHECDEECQDHEDPEEHEDNSDREESIRAAQDRSRPY